MPDLEAQLTALGAAIDWPEPSSPSMARWRRAPRERPWRRLALAAAAVVVAAAALLAIPPTRDAIASWVDLHVLIHRVNTVPTPSALPSGPLGRRLGLGVPTTLAAAQGQVAWRIAVPSSLGPPDEVYSQPPPTGPAGGEVTLVYGSRPGIKASGQTGVWVLITEARGTVEQGFFAKTLGPGTTLEPVTFAGHQGYWISGQPHEFGFIDGNGDFRTETMRLATNTLIFDDAGTIVRVEGDLTRDQAIQIASSMS